MPDLEYKIDKLTYLLEEAEMHRIKGQCSSNQALLVEIIINTVLASAVGYFMFRIMDAHFRE